MAKKKVRRLKSPSKDIARDYLPAIVAGLQKMTKGGTKGFLSNWDEIIDDMIRQVSKSSRRAAREASRKLFTNVPILKHRKPTLFKKPRCRKAKKADCVKVVNMESPDELLDIIEGKRGKHLFRPLRKEEHIVLVDKNGVRHEVWRGKDNAIYHESKIGDSMGERRGTEREHYSAKEHGDKNVKGMERTHSLGQGTGFESPYGILYAPKLVNQTLQNNGVEEFLRQLHKSLKGTGQSVIVKTRTEAHTMSNRLKNMSYKIEISDGKGGSIPLLEYRIEVGNPPNPAVSHGVNYLHQPNIVKQLLPNVKGAENFKSLLNKSLS